MVDAHVHLLPVRLQAAIRGFFDRYGIDSGHFAYPADHGDVCDRLAAEGVTEVWSLPYARLPGSAADLNKSMAGLVAARRGGPVRVTGGCTVHPGDDQPLTIVRSAVEDMGLRVLKLHCSVGDFTPDDPRLGPVWEYSAEVALPVVLHAGHAADGHTDDAELQPVAEVARRHPGARVIIAHCGHTASQAALRLVAAQEHVYADLTPVIHHPVLAGGRGADHAGGQDPFRLGRAQHRADRDPAAGRPGRPGPAGGRLGGADRRCRAAPDQ